MKYFQSEPDLFLVDKPVVWTPLQALEELRQLESMTEDMSLTYAGRLDPMAEGLLLVLAGPRVHEKDAFLKLDKQYEVTALLGVETDSHDLLGLPTVSTSLVLPLNSPKVEEVLGTFVGVNTFPLPAFSSPLVQGKPLFWWKRNKPGEVESPLRTSRVYDISDISLSNVTAAELYEYIFRTVPQVQGDFRQETILPAWQAVLNSQNFQVVKFMVYCESGTYVRSLVHELGKRLGTNACVYKLRRIKVSGYSV